MITFITWVNDLDQYNQFVNSVNFKANFIPIGQSFKSLSEAYAYGQDNIDADIIVYCHQDIIIRDPQFEQKVTKFFAEHENVGFAGVIGTALPGTTYWWENPQGKRGWIRQSDRTGNQRAIIFDFGKGTREVRQMDGCILMTQRKDWEFPALPGIHFLDLWMCNLANERGFTNWIVDVEVEHTSWGETTSQAFSDNHKIYLERWQKFLKP